MLTVLGSCSTACHVVTRFGRGGPMREVPQLGSQLRQALAEPSLARLLLVWESGSRQIGPC